MNKPVVGQEVLLFGIGFVDGKVISVFPTIDVQSDAGFMKFDKDGKETEASRCRRLGVAEGEYGPGPEWEPWEIVATTPEETRAYRAKHYTGPLPNPYENRPEGRGKL